ncbi:unnamed protein product [Rotaria sordida]|uniref:Carboxypeptidase n=2 Tax=Rotaria sordida TaxID=392033 RepID=A0A818VA33_9BILA|nr:unnamed protein product [Rotaria sordida]CAF1183291.1 unnamed protein product [Rotaria sordida]CAF1201214.1 unnamed protein product [Rotaria sordida]CAF3703289.1 unnamed protein product [Rotaria sordida]
MMLHKIFIILLLIVLFNGNIQGQFRRLSYPNGKHSIVKSNDDPGEPLFLTPYIEQGKIEEARRLSSVELPPFKRQSFSGYLTVNKEFNSNMFFWFFPAQNDNINAPVLLWLQGGPGETSLYGLFNEHGPIQINTDESLSERSITWNSLYNLLYIDNPVGTGYSFTSNDQGYARSEDDVARDLYSALTQFFQIYTDYVSNSFYITGESYAGKYVPSIGYKIHIENQNPQVKVKINLVGLAMGNGWIDPYRQYVYGPLLYQIGLIDSEQLFYVNLQSDLVRYAISQKRFSDASKISDSLFYGDLNNTSYLTNVTGLRAYYNYLQTDVTPNMNNYIKFITNVDRRRQIHVGNLTFHDDDQVAINLGNDIFQSIPSQQLTILFDNYKILIYNGLLDIICAESLTLNWISDLQWSHSNEYKNAIRQIWKVNSTDDQIAGYIKIVNKFMLASIRNAGHRVPIDQPRAMFDLLKRFIELTFIN